jgi:hypothetical protein
MFNKFIASVITVTLSLSTTSAFADDVKLIKSCTIYETSDVTPTGKLTVKAYYPYVRRDNHTKIDGLSAILIKVPVEEVFPETRSNSLVTNVYISPNCLQKTSWGNVKLYPD